MRITEFANMIAVRERGRKQVNIAQIKEIVKIINEMLEGKLYKDVRKL